MPKYRILKRAFMFGQLLEPGAVIFLNNAADPVPAHLEPIPEEAPKAPPPKADVKK